MTEMKLNRIPSVMKGRYKEITDLTEQYSCELLNDEYSDLIRSVTATLCCKKPCLLVKGNACAWACAVIHAVGMVNFLFDKSNCPYVSASDLYKHFNISSSNGSLKSKAIRDSLDMYPLCEEWRLPSLKDIQLSPLWNLFDIRTMPKL
ncbi:DUF6398 domain-containing protein [Psychromonas ossibalaenae]|uniref:DUF6398 domain-containing protein n=1 Tax=Psychromonas ossibalaenae TaxID=444922 RepID=UPI0003701DAD